MTAAERGKGTVLIVEDELLIRLDLADQLRSAGLIVIEASTGDEALTILKANDAIDFVVSDIRMPGPTDGMELTAWLRRERPKIRIVLVSGFAATQDMTTIADAALIKPVDPSLFVREVGRLLAAEIPG
jgi:two-component system, response regulator PdtaR